MSVIRLQTIDDSRLDPFARLTEHQLRNALEAEQGVLIAESHLVVEVALKSGVEPISFLADEAHLCVAEKLVEAGNDVPVYVLPDDELQKLTGFRLTRGLLCAMRRPAEKTVAEVVSGARHVAVIEDLVDVTNVGALFRNAAALGADAVVLSPRCADPLCRRAVRVSMGTVFQVPFARASVGEWPRGVADHLHDQGMECCAMALTPEAVPIDDSSLTPSAPRALFFGCEGYGLTDAALCACDRAVIIPMAHDVDSLNVAASSAVGFWQLFR